MNSVNCVGYVTAVQCPVICAVLHTGDARVAHLIDSSKKSQISIFISETTMINVLEKVVNNLNAFIVQPSHF